MVLRRFEESKSLSKYLFLESCTISCSGQFIVTSRNTKAIKFSQSQGIMKISYSRKACISVLSIPRKKKEHQNKQKNYPKTKQQQKTHPQKTPVLGAWYDWNKKNKIHHRSSKSNDKLTTLQICRSIDWRRIITIPKRLQRTQIYTVVTLNPVISFIATLCHRCGIGKIM